MENSHNTHVEKMLKRVGELVMTRDCQGVMQTPEYKVNNSSSKILTILVVFKVRGFNKELYLHPAMDINKTNML